MKNLLLLAVCLMALTFTGQTICGQNTIPANGNVGIGIAPSAPLTVKGPDNDGVNATLKIVSDAEMLIDGNEIDTDSPYGLYLNNNVNRRVVLAKGGGNVGIGTGSPMERLHIDGAIRGAQGGGALRIKTEYGYVDIGPKSSSGFMHFYTDQVKYYFDKEIWVKSGKIGSYSEDLQLRTGSTTRMTIDNSTGRVGIGVTNPSEKLDVNGVIVSSGATGGALEANNPDNQNQFVQLGWSEPIFGERIARIRYGGSASKGLLIQGMGDVPQFIVKANGNVGVGTAVPDTKFCVYGNPGEGIKVLAEGKSTEVLMGVHNGNYGFLNLGGGTILRGNGQASKFDGVVHWGSGRGVLSTDRGASLELGGQSNAYIDFANSMSDPDFDVRIQQVSNSELSFVGASSDLRVSVQGRLSAKEIKVTANGRWADYVFEEDYKLPPLREVKMYIEENGHLPNVPSEASILAEGIDLAEITTIQQEKIEELFLYVIDLNEKIEQLVKENEELKKNSK